MNDLNNSTQRFSDRVDDYVKYRPTYPVEIIEFLKSELNFNSSKVVVDVGSGTGISSELFLSNGNKVYGVEPNDGMRCAAENNLKRYSNFTSIKGTSSLTNLPDKVADIIIAAQAFHWFEPESTKLEFQRILKDNGYVILIWNDRRTTGTPFLEQYEALINEFGTDYKKVKHKNIEGSRIETFLGPYKLFSLYNSQEFDFHGLLGRLTSSSYVPNKNHPNFDEMCSALRSLFEIHQLNGKIKIEYDTQLFYSQFNFPRENK